MSYQLTLTKDERKAFDWVGDRYAAGAIADVLEACMGEGVEWSQEGDITFNIAESQAWEIRDLAEEEDQQFPCFCDDLTEKMVSFLNQIV